MNKKEMYEDYCLGEQGSRFHDNRRALTFVELKIGFFIWIQKMRVLEFICNKFEHVLIEDGYATPESGAIEMRCVRCGQQWHTQLY